MSHSWKSSPTAPTTIPYTVHRADWREVAVLRKATDEAIQRSRELLRMPGARFGSLLAGRRLFRLLDRLMMHQLLPRVPAMGRKRTLNCLHYGVESGH